MSSSASASIEVKGLSKEYRDGGNVTHALRNINFSLAHGESAAIIGPSGSGKTTLLEIMAGLNSPTHGTVTIQGKNVHEGSDSEVSHFRNETMGFVFQFMYLQEYLTALQNVMVPLIISGKSFSHAQKRARELLKKVGLADRLNHHPRMLSGGEQQRVAIARALANEPKLIFADEPTGKLDRKNADAIMDLLDEVRAEGVSVLLITHDEKVAERFDRKIHLTHGALA